MLRKPPVVLFGFPSSAYFSACCCAFMPNRFKDARKRPDTTGLQWRMADRRSGFDRHNAVADQNNASDARDNGARSLSGGR
jgi:hypothetical protein